MEIAGFEIEGPNQNITYTQANTYRQSIVNAVYTDPSNPDKDQAAWNGGNRKNIFHGNGISIKRGTYINVHGNKVHNTTGSGIRVDNGDYLRLHDNEVYNTTWWTWNAPSAIVIAQSKNIYNDNTRKMRIERNLVYNNINKIPYFNPSYTEIAGKCNGADNTHKTADDKNSTDYGCGGQNKIIDGSGVYITRNNSDGAPFASDENPNDQYIGQFYFANNVAYGNGMNGLVVHKTNNTVATNNTIYGNGEVPTVGNSEVGYLSYGLSLAQLILL